MISTDELERIFFVDLKSYNNSNFKTLEKSDLSDINNSAVIHKAFSSIVTRYFIFREKHTELSTAELNMLYFQLKIDQIAKYFVDYPESDVRSLQDFQNELRKYSNTSKTEKQ